MDTAQPITGQTLSLHIVKKEHLPQLFKAAEDEVIWTHNKTKNETLDLYLNHYFESLETQQLQQKQVPYVVIRNSDKRVLGSSRFYDISEHDKRLAIGFTWYIPDVWGTTVNPECKQLLLTYVFEGLAYNRVEFHVDSRNLRSINAMKKLGSIEEGVLRQHKIVQDDFVRDTVLFSIVKSDWATVKKGLEKRLR